MTTYQHIRSCNFLQRRKCESSKRSWTVKKRTSRWRWQYSKSQRNSSSSHQRSSFGDPFSRSPSLVFPFAFLTHSSTFASAISSGLIIHSYIWLLALLAGSIITTTSFRSLYSRSSRVAFVTPTSTSQLCIPSTVPTTEWNGAQTLHTPTTALSSDSTNHQLLLVS